MPSRNAPEERRYHVEFRSQDGRILTGQLLSYGREYDLGRFTETYRPGCFRKSTHEGAKRLPLMIEHGHDRVPVGVSVGWSDAEDALCGTWEFDTRAEAQEAARMAEKGLLGGLSVGYRAIRTDWSARDDGRQHADRREAAILETSLCAIPALEDAGVIAVRSAGPWRQGTPRLDEARAWLASIRAGTVGPNG